MMHTQEKWIYYSTSKQTSSYFLQIIEGKQKMIFFVVLQSLIYSILVIRRPFNDLRNH